MGSFLLELGDVHEIEGSQLLRALAPGDAVDPVPPAPVLHHPAAVGAEVLQPLLGHKVQASAVDVVVAQNLPPEQLRVPDHLPLAADNDHGEGEVVEVVPLSGVQLVHDLVENPVDLPLHVDHLPDAEAAHRSRHRHGDAERNGTDEPGGRRQSQADHHQENEVQTKIPAPPVIHVALAFLS